MKNATDLLPKIAQGQLTAVSTQRTFDQNTVDATQYFFARMRSVWGAAKYEKTFPNEIDVKVAKREWAHNIGKFTREEIDLGFDNAKRMIERGEDDFMWPNVGLILKGCKRYLDPSHKPAVLALPLPPEEIERKRQVGLKHLENIKNLMGAKCA